MSLSKNGTITSDCKLTSINDLGLWILIEDKEYFIPFKDYPGFRASYLDQIFKIRYYPSGQLSWEELDIDIDIKALSEPESFPLIFRH